jgi:hypothetical protein
MLEGPFLNIGVTFASFQQSGMEPCCSIKSNNIDRGTAKMEAKDFQKIGGIPSGPGAEEVLSIISLDLTTKGSKAMEPRTMFWSMGFRIGNTSLSTVLEFVKVKFNN